MSHAPFVLAAYGFWALAFAGYLVWLVQRSRRTRHLLERLNVPPSE